MITENEMAEQAATLIGPMLIALQRKTGLSMAAIMVGTHAEIVAMMATTLGGPITAECCDRAARRVRNMPSMEDAGLTFAAPAGHA